MNTNKETPTKVSKNSITVHLTPDEARAVSDALAQHLFQAMRFDATEDTEAVARVKSRVAFLMEREGLNE